MHTPVTPNFTVSIRLGWNLTDASTDRYKSYNTHAHSSTHTPAPHLLALSITPCLLLWLWLCEPAALYLFSPLFNIQFIFSSQGTEQGAEVFHQRSLVVFEFCLLKVPGLYLDSQENMGTITEWIAWIFLLSVEAATRGFFYCESPLGWVCWTKL